MEALQTNTRISLSNILVTTDFSTGFKECSAVCSRSGPPIRGKDYCGARA